MIRSDCSDYISLQDIQKFGLQRRRQVVYIVEKQSPAMRGLE
jgi:hypothetical protein